VLPAERVFGVAAARLRHLVEGGYAVAGLELGYILTNGVNDAGDVVALVYVRVHPLGNFPGGGLVNGSSRLRTGGIALLPVFWIGSAHNHFGDYLIWTWLWDGGVDDLDLGAWVNDCFLHCEMARVMILLAYMAELVSVCYPWSTFGME